MQKGPIYIYIYIHLNVHQNFQINETNICKRGVKGSIFKQTNPTNFITSADDSDCTRQLFFHLGNFPLPLVSLNSHYIYRLAIVNSLHKQTNEANACSETRTVLIIPLQCAYSHGAG
jgi:hypothetical protein